MTNLRIIYGDGMQVEQSKSCVTERIVQLAGLHLDLPEQLIVEFTDLSPTTYGESIIHITGNHKIKLSGHLSTKEIIFPLIHELIHVEQMYRGRLAISRSGDPVWDGVVYKLDYAKMTYHEYRQLPWEQDVANREKALLTKILN